MIKKRVFFFFLANTNPAAVLSKYCNHKKIVDLKRSKITLEINTYIISHSHIISLILYVHDLKTLQKHLSRAVGFCPYRIVKLCTNVSHELEERLKTRLELQSLFRRE